MFQLYFLLLCGHALGDYGLQSEFVANNKVRTKRQRFTPEELAKMQVIWPHLLTSHALIHGFFVFMFTMNYAAGIGEFLAHWFTDFGKGEGWYGFHGDQFIHVVTKLLWVLLIHFAII